MPSCSPTGTVCASARRWRRRRRPSGTAIPSACSGRSAAHPPAGIGTKAQQALGLQREQGKAARRVQTRAERECEQARQFQLRQTKRKEKHRGH